MMFRIFALLFCVATYLLFDEQARDVVEGIFWIVADLAYNIAEAVWRAFRAWLFGEHKLLRAVWAAFQNWLFGEHRFVRAVWTVFYGWLFGEHRMLKAVGAVAVRVLSGFLKAAIWLVPRVVVLAIAVPTLILLALGMSIGAGVRWVVCRARRVANEMLSARRERVRKIRYSPRYVAVAGTLCSLAVAWTAFCVEIPLWRTDSSIEAATIIKASVLDSTGREEPVVQMESNSKDNDYALGKGGANDTNNSAYAPEGGGRQSNRQICFCVRGKDAQCYLRASKRRAETPDIVDRWAETGNEKWRRKVQRQKQRKRNAQDRVRE